MTSNRATLGGLAAVTFCMLATPAVATTLVRTCPVESDTPPFVETWPTAGERRHYEWQFDCKHYEEQQAFIGVEDAFADGERFVASRIRWPDGTERMTTDFVGRIGTVGYRYAAGSRYAPFDPTRYWQSNKDDDGVPALDVTAAAELFLPARASVYAPISTDPSVSEDVSRFSFAVACGINATGRPACRVEGRSWLTVGLIALDIVDGRLPPRACTFEPYDGVVIDDVSLAVDGVLTDIAPLPRTITDPVCFDLGQLVRVFRLGGTAKFMSRWTSTVSGMSEPGSLTLEAAMLPVAIDLAQYMADNFIRSTARQHIIPSLQAEAEALLAAERPEVP